MRERDQGAGNAVASNRPSGLMRNAKLFGLFAAIAAFPVVDIAEQAGALAWSAPLSVADAAAMVGFLAVPLFACSLILGRVNPSAGPVSTAVVAWFGLGLVHLARLRFPIGRMGWTEPWHWLVLLCIVLGVALWIGIRFDPKARFVATFVPILLVLQLAVLGVGLLRINEPTPAPVVAAGTSVEEGLPSIWFIVLDSHASPKVLRDQHGVDLSAETLGYEGAGFRVWDDARANYTHTIVSVPSLLSGEIWDEDTNGESYATMLAGLHGDTPLIAAIAESGFAVRMILSNWSRSGCGTLVDDCFEASRYDDHWFAWARTTSLAYVIPSLYANPWPAGGVRALETISTVSADNDVSRHFTFVHALASHTPLILNADCESVGLATGSLGEQLECTHRTVFEALASIDLEDEIVIITADHGYGSGELSLDPSTWTDAATRDVMSAFTAISTPNGCETSMPEQLSGSQILPLIVNCYGGDLNVPPHRFFQVSPQRWGGLRTTELDWDGWSLYSP